MDKAREKGITGLTPGPEVLENMHCSLTTHDPYRRPYLARRIPLELPCYKKKHVARRRSDQFSEDVIRYVEMTEFREFGDDDHHGSTRSPRLDRREKSCEVEAIPIPEIERLNTPE